MHGLLLTECFVLREEFVYENKLGQIWAASWDITADCLSLLQNMTSENSVNTGDEDYWLVQSRSNGLTSFSQKGWKGKNTLAGPWKYRDCLTSIFGDQFLQSIMHLFYSPSEMQSWWSQGVQWDFEVQKSRRQRRKMRIPGFLPAEKLWPQVNRVKLKLKVSLVGHVTVVKTLLNGYFFST